MLPTLLPCYSLDYLGWQLLDQPFFFYIFSSFHPSLPRFPHGVNNYFAVTCASSALFRPPPSYPRSRYPCPRSHLRYCPHFCPRSRTRSRAHPVFTYGPPPPSPSPSPSPPPPPSRPRSRPRSRPALLSSPPPSFPFLLPLRPRPHNRSRPRSHPRPRYRLRSRPRLQSHP